MIQLPNSDDTDINYFYCANVKKGATQLDDKFLASHSFHNSHKHNKLRLCTNCEPIDAGLFDEKN